MTRVLAGAPSDNLFGHGKEAPSSLSPREGLRPAPTQSRQRVGGEGLCPTSHCAPHPNPLPAGRAKTPSADTVAAEGTGRSIKVSRWSQAAACLVPPQQVLLGRVHSTYARIINVQTPSGRLLTLQGAGSLQAPLALALATDM